MAVGRDGYATGLPRQDDDFARTYGLKAAGLPQTVDPSSLRVTDVGSDEGGFEELEEF